MTRTELETLGYRFIAFSGKGYQVQLRGQKKNCIVIHVYNEKWKLKLSTLEKKMVTAATVHFVEGRLANDAK